MSGDERCPLVNLVHVRVGAGVALTRVLHLAIRDGLKGLSFAVGIPGTLGGAVVMNAGTEVGAIWDVVECVRLLLPTGEMVDVRPGGGGGRLSLCRIA